MQSLKYWWPTIRRIVPVLISLVLIGIMVTYAPWPEVFDTLGKMRPYTILLLVCISLGYFSLKALRFHYLLKAMDIREPFGLVFLSYMSAQPVSLLPAGEIYRTRTLQRLTGVPMSKSLPTFTTQGLLEGTAMAIVGAICALAIGTLRAPVLILTVVILGSIYILESGKLAKLLPVINKLPLITVSRQKILDFTRGNQAIFSWRWMPVLALISLAVEILGAAVPFVAVRGLGGDINIFQAGLAYIIPLLVGFISFLPGGFGAAEQSSIGILLLSGTGIAIAVAATLIMRVTVVITGFGYGVIAALYERFSGLRKE